MGLDQLRRHAQRLFAIGVAAADPKAAVLRRLKRVTPGRVAGEELNAGRLRLIAVGKAACSMVEGVGAAWGEPWEGPAVVVTDAENARAQPLRTVVHLGEHPLPDEGSVRAGRAVEAAAHGLSEADALLVLVSGGASSLVVAPVAGISLQDKVETHRLLLSCGASIDEVNAVRKHLSRLKGGGLVRQASPARLEALILSDVVGDDLSTVGSGPTVGDPTTFADALSVLDRYGLRAEVPAPVLRHLGRGDAGGVAETLKPGDPALSRVKNVLLGGNRQSLQAVAAGAAELGYEVELYGVGLVGEARRAGESLSRELGGQSARPRALLAGGETTVTLRGAGRGGRNQELALAFALAAERLSAGRRTWVLLSAGTDGRDGPTDAAGAVVDRGTLRRGRASGRRPGRDLSRNDSYAFLEASGDLLRTGPTGTNVADLQILLEFPG